MSYEKFQRVEAVTLPSGRSVTAGMVIEFRMVGGQWYKGRVTSTWEKGGVGYFAIGRKRVCVNDVIGFFDRTRRN